MKKKCIVMFSGGLDSRLASVLMKEKGFNVLLVHFKLPFGCVCGGVQEFAKEQGFDLKIFDVSKGKLLKDYLEVLRRAKHGRGAGVNPCVDCKIFMLKKTRGFADKEKIEVIATGEVVGQRPMSQQKKQLEIIEKEAKLHERIIRPLIEIGIRGRQRKQQIKLAEKFKIKYPSPGGGCILCEKELKKRFEFLFKRGIGEKELKLVNIGRHFIIDNKWIVIGRNQKENKVIEKFKEVIVPDYVGPSALILDGEKLHSQVRDIDRAVNRKKALNSTSCVNKSKKSRAERDKLIKKVKELIKAYSKQGSLEDRKKFEGYKL